MTAANLTVSWEEEGVTCQTSFVFLYDAESKAIAMSSEHMYAYVNGTDRDGTKVALTYRFGALVEEAAS